MNLPELFEKNNLLALEPIKRIEAVESFLSNNYDDVGSEWPLRHHIIGTKYAREIFLPKGSLLTSKIHNFDHISVISQGEVTIYDNHGQIERIKAPFTWVAEKGTKRLIYVHQDTVWTTFHELKEDFEMTKENLTNYVAHDSDLSWLKLEDYSCQL